jgi:hypothetical protein
MLDTILLNEKSYSFSEDNLPCLVTYHEGLGGSNFSMAVAANLFLQGSKLLILTAFPMAKDNFIQQVGNHTSQICFVTQFSDLNILNTPQAIIVESGNETLFVQIMVSLPDMKERVVLLKNIERFSEETIKKCLGLDKILLSGDIDACNSREQILANHMNTVIAFNQTEAILPTVVPELEKWSGYLLNDKDQGIIKIQKK